MAKNNLPQSVGEMLDLGQHVLQGLTAHGATLGILQYTPATYGPKVTALAVKQQLFNVARSATAAAYAGVHAQQAVLRKACLTGRKILSISLGDDWSPAWVAPGWPDQTTAVPEDLVGLKALGAALRDFLGNDTAYEVNTSKVVFTASAFSETLTTLAPFEVVLTEKRMAQDQALDARKAEDKALRGETRGVIGILTTLLDPNSPLWDAFGLNRPGAKVTPAQPALPTLTAVAGGSVLAAVDAVPLATYYRWFAQVVGVDADFRFLGRTQDPTKDAADLPAAGVLRVKVQAANEAGPGKASPVATITLGP